MDAIVEGRNDEEAQIQDLSVVDAPNWSGTNNQSIENNNSTLLYIAVEYVKDYKGEDSHSNLTPQPDTYSDFTPHVSPLDPNMSSVARYSPVPVQFQEPTTNYNPVVIHHLVSQDSNGQNEQFVNNLNTNGNLESIPAVLCNNDIREVSSQYLQMVDENINNMIGQSDGMQLVNENDQKVELLITDQATGISYSVNAQELLVERCLENEQQLLEALAPDHLLESDLLALDDNTLKSELHNEIIHDSSVVTSVDAQVVNNYIDSLADSDIKSLDDDIKSLDTNGYKMDTRRTAEIDEEQLLSCVYTITDKPILSRARASLPEGYLVINTVNDENAVFAKKQIPKCTQFGPLEGVLVHSDEIEKGAESDLQYFIEINSNFYKVDVSDENNSNWMGFVRKAITYEEQNLVITQENDSIYFTSTRIILPKQELKVGYSCQYAQWYDLKTLQPAEVNTWPCYECPAKFPTSEDLQKHLNIHDDELDENVKPKKLSKKKHRYFKTSKAEAVECTECKEVFFSNVNYKLLKNHLSQKHFYNEVIVEHYFIPVSTYKCEHCDTSFRSEALQTIHTLEHVPDLSEEQTNHICPQCQRKFPTQKQLILHVTSHALPKIVCHTENIKCPVCYKMFPQRERLQKHMMVHGSEDSKPLQCKTCNKRFLNNSALACHLKTHVVGKKVFECPVCKESFDHVLKLKMHVPKHCINNQFTCPHCKKVFKKYSMIRKHIRAFHCEHKHHCQQCSKVFPTQDKLRMHLLRHSDHREFLCADCGKQFKRKDKLKEHCKRIHSEERENIVVKPPKPVTAPSGKKFTPKVEPTDFHRFIYKCHSCMVGFKRRGMLVNHLAKRHPDIPPDSVPELNLPILLTTRDYYCQYCDKVYKSSSKRKMHILKNHPGAALPISNRKQSSVPEVAELPNPTFSQTVGSVTARPQNCTWCHKQYASKAKLLQHQRKKHPDKIPAVQKDEDTPVSVNVVENQQDPMNMKLDAVDMSVDNLTEAYQTEEAEKVDLNDIMGNDMDTYGDEDSQYCHLSINENDIMEPNDLENPNSHLYRLLTSANNEMLPPR